MCRAMTAAVLHAIRGDPLADPAVLRRLWARYFIWDAFVAGQPRIALQPLVLSARLHRAAVAVAERAVAVLAGRVAPLALADEEERRRYGLPADVERLAAASRRAGDLAALMRVDLLLGADLEWHLCEINADCPGGHNEAFGLPRLARGLGFRDAVDPGDVVGVLASRLCSLARRPGGRPGTVGLTYATAYAEDLQVCALVRRAVEARGVEAVLLPATAPRLLGGRLCYHGRPLDVLYRFFPTEYMDGQGNVAAIATAIESGALRTLTSFAHMYAQSKTSMARAWSRLATLEPADADFVTRHLPESRDVAEVPPDRLLGERAGWVLKRALGRVGDEVFVGALLVDEEWQAVVEGVTQAAGRGERWIAQRFVPQQPIPTPWGERLLTLGAYVLDGSFVGYFGRITAESHVSHDALVVPVFVEEKP